MTSGILKLKLSKFEKIWFLTAIIVLVAVQIYSVEPGTGLTAATIGLIAAVTGMLNVLLVAKRSIWNYLFGIVNVVLYAAISYNSGYGGDFVTFLFYYFPLQFVGIYTWRKHIHLERETSEVESKSLSVKGWIIVLVNIGIGTLLTMEVLPVITNIFGMSANEHPLIDAFTTYTGITAGVLMALRYKDQWYIWIAVNFGSVLMWIAMIGNPDVTNAGAMTVMWIAYLINAVYGAYNWRRD